MNKKKYFEFLYLILLGALSSLSLPPYNFLVINFFTFSSFFIFLVKKKNLPKNKRGSFFYGWLFGFGYFFTNLYWIPISLTFDDNFKFLIPFALIVIPAFLAIFYGLVTFLLFMFNYKRITSLFFLFPLLFGLIEFLRGYILTGFPWNLFVFSFSNYLEILQVLSVVGTYALNLFCITLFICPAIIILRDSKKRFFNCHFFYIYTINIIFFWQLKN